MVIHVALLRAVNVGGVSLKMADLRATAEALGLANVQTLLQSGNLAFEAETADAGLEARLEEALAARFGLATTVIVRSAARWRATIDANPFPDEAERNPAHLLLIPLKTAPKAGIEEALQAAIKGREVAQVVGDFAYVVYPDGIGHSKLTTPTIERALGVKGTGRNWNTVLKLAALIER